jgi:hypothetical protein
MLQRGDGFAEDFRGEDARVKDGAAVGWSVTAVNAASCEVNADIALFKLGNPCSRCEAIPSNYAPCCRLRVAAEEDDVVTLRVKVPGEEVAYLSRAAGDDDLHAGVRFSCFGQRLALLQSSSDEFSPEER